MREEVLIPLALKQTPVARSLMGCHSICLICDSLTGCFVSFLTDSESISDLTFTNVCQLMHTDALEWRSHCSFPQALKEVLKKKAHKAITPVVLIAFFLFGNKNFLLE